MKRFDVKEIVASPETQNGLNQIYKQAHGRFVIQRDLIEDHNDEYDSPVPKVTILHPWGVKALPERLLLSARDFHIIIAPEDIRDSSDPRRQFRDVNTNVMALSTFRARLSI